MTLEQSICHFAMVTPDKVAAICHEQQVTYQQLWKSIETRAAELTTLSVCKNRPYVFRATQNIDFIVTYCALHHIGAIAVPLSSDVSDAMIQEVDAKVQDNTYASDIVDILYTTGTTGKSKGVMLSEKALVSCADNFISDLGFCSDLLFIICSPLNHIASLFKLHPILTVGGTVCILDGLRDINAFYLAFNLPYTKFATFLVPASIRILLQFSHDRLAALVDKIDFIETGAAPITKNDMESLSKALPKSRLYNTYGGTEIGCVCTYNFNDGKYMEGCIGYPMKNAIIDVTPSGEILVSGPTIMSGYVEEDTNTSRVLQDGWIHGSDLGYFDDEGMVHLSGRKGNVINVGGYKINPEEVEVAASTYPNLHDCICIPAKHPVLGTVMKLLVVLADGEVLDKRSLALFLKSKLETYKIPQLYDQVSKIERTYNGKINRKFYG